MLKQEFLLDNQKKIHRHQLMLMNINVGKRCLSKYCYVIKNCVTKYR